MDMKETGKKLKEARNAKKLTPDAIYRKTHMHPRIIEALENGEKPEGMSQIYYEAFLRKYKKLLGIETGEPAKKQSSIIKEKASSKKDKFFTEPARQISSLSTKEYAPIVALTARILAAVLVVVILWNFMRIVNRAIARGRESKAKKAVAKIERGGQKDSTTKRTSPISPVRSAVKTDPISTVEKKTVINQKLSLAISSTDNVWVLVKKDGDVAFKGILYKGKGESWKADEKFELRVGRLEALQFVVNGRNMGILGKGVKDIVIDNSMVKIGRKSIRL